MKTRLNIVLILSGAMLFFNGILNAQVVIKANNSVGFNNTTIESGPFNSGAFGYFNEATGQSSSAFGYSSKASGSFSSAFGFDNNATGDSGSSALGYINLATGVQSCAIGNLNDASGYRSSAFGFLNEASVDNSSAFGHGALSDVYGLMAVGIYNANPAGSATTWTSSDPVFIVGNGEDENNRSTALTILKNGNMGIGTTNPQAKLDVLGRINLLDGSSSTYIGKDAGGASAETNNTFLGFESGDNNTGSENTFVGSQAGESNTGDANTFIGQVAGQFNTSGQRNVFLGQLAGISLSGTSGSSTGNDNTFVGVVAGGNNTTGSLNTTLGRGADVSTGALSSATAIGAFASVNASNKMQLGASTTTLSTSGGYTIVSDGRFKKEVKNDIEGLDFIMNLKPVSYRFDYQQYDDFLRGEKGSKDLSEDYKQQLKEKTKERELGFIAQEVAKAADELNISFNGVYRPQHETDNYALDYGRLSVPLVKATQEQQAAIEALKEENVALKQRLAKIEAMLSGNTEERTTISKLTNASLQQNAPNPFTEATNINYFIPENVKSASLQVLDQNGRIIKRIPIQATGNGQITLQANLLSAGTYSYSLVLDGQVMETKQMVLTH